MSGKERMGGRQIKTANERERKRPGRGKKKIQRYKMKREIETNGKNKDRWW